MLRNRTVLLVFRLAVGAVFVYAGLVKILEPLDFAGNIANYQMVGPSLSFLTALILPWLEVLCGLGLALGPFKHAAALLISIMLGFFIILTLITIVRGLNVDCGCFGALSRTAGWSLVLEDAVMLFMTLCVLRAD
jgi:putative oxidoreductase